MGHFCGWCGSGLGANVSQQTLCAMAAGLGAPKGPQPQSIYDESCGLATSKGLHPLSSDNQDGIRAVLVGTPDWDNNELSELATGLTPAAALIKAYLLYGTKLLNRLHGPFALVVLDGDNALAAIDRIGIHSLSYSVKNGLFIFSTSTGSVARHPFVKQRIDAQAIFNYFYFYNIPGPGTVYSGIEKLLPSQYVQFQDGHIKKGFYWKLPYNDNNQASFRSQKEQFHILLRKAVGAANSGESTATFLSGGTDSSTVTGVLTEIKSAPVDTYSIGFGAEGFDEMEYARLAARHFKARPHEYYLMPDDVLTAIPLISSVYDEPFANESAVPTYYCAKMAAEDGIHVMLAGDGGDEIFGGNDRYARQMIFEQYSRIPEYLRSRLIEPIVFTFPGADYMLPLRKVRSYIRQASIPLPERLESYNFVYRQALDEMFEPEFLSSVNPDIPKAMLRDAYFRTDSDHPVNRMLHLDLKFTLADNDLRKVTRMCNAAGVNVRYPLLNEELVAFSGQLPPDFKVKGRKLRWFFKESLKDYLPREIINKSKHGFGLPFGVWTLSHAPLNSFVNDTLDSFESRGYLRPSYIQSIRQQHAEAHPTYFGKMIWVMIILEQWLKNHAHDS